MEYRDRVRIAAMQSLMQQPGLSAQDIAQRAEVFADEMCKARVRPQLQDDIWGHDDYV